MKIKTIHIENFRNIEKLDVEFDDVNIIWGENAQGKTNLIEAIYLFTGAKSFRGARDRELKKLDCDKCSLSMSFINNNREQRAEITIDERRSAILNGVRKKSASELGDELKAVVFSPVHLSMIKDGPRERRYFIDSALCQIKANYRKLLREYKRALEQRNSLLKDLAKHPEMENMLYIWNRNLAKTGAKIIFQRMKYIESLTPYVKNIFAGISGNRENTEIRYVGSDSYEADIDDIEKKLIKAFEESKVTDIINKTTTKGPHRDDIEILINGKSARIYGSQGQQRSCVLALKLAEASLLKELTGAQPVVLLDDVMSELDEKRQDYILNHINEAQVFITCCDKEQILRLKQGRTLHMVNGRIM